MLKKILLLAIVAFWFAATVKGNCLAGGMTSSRGHDQISSLECNEILITELPFQPAWNTEAAHFGFTMVMPSSYGPQYLPSNLYIAQPGVLSFISTTGLFRSRNLGNALGVGLMFYSPLSLSTSFILPPSQAGMEQAGLWIGLNEANYVSIAVVSNSPTERSIRTTIEINGRVGDTITYNLQGTENQIKLWIEADPTSMSISTFFSTDNTPNKILAWRHDKIPPEWFGLGKAVILDQIGTNAFGGIYASRVNAATSSTYNFTNFEVNQLPLYPNNPDGCYPSYSPYLPYGLPLSPIECSEIGNGLETSRVLTFQGDNGGIKDKNGVGTGLTMSLPSENGNSILAYDITTGDGFLTYVPTRTIPQGNVFELNNALGLGVSPQVAQKISATIAKPMAGSGNFEQAGIVIGVSQKSCIKLQIMSLVPSNPTMYTLRVHNRVDGINLNSFDINNFMNGATETDPGSDITLSFTTDPITSTISTSYNGTLWRTLSVPQEWFSAPTSGDIGTHLFCHIDVSVRYRSPALPPYEIKFSTITVENV